jgi:hypothetical protein
LTVQHVYVAQPVDTSWICIPYRYISDTRWIRIQQVSEKNKSDTQANRYWVTIAHHWIHFGPAHLNKHAWDTAKEEAGACEDGGGGREKAAEE